MPGGSGVMLVYCVFLPMVRSGDSACEVRGAGVGLVALYCMVGSPRGVLCAFCFLFLLSAFSFCAAAQDRTGRKSLLRLASLRALAIIRGLRLVLTDLADLTDSPKAGDVVSPSLAIGASAHHAVSCRGLQIMARGWALSRRMKHHSYTKVCTQITCRLPSDTDAGRLCWALLQGRDNHNLCRLN
jgi:hypothetical protein